MIVAVGERDKGRLVVLQAVLLLHLPTTGISSSGVSAADAAVVVSVASPLLADDAVPSTGNVVPDPFVGQF